MHDVSVRMTLTLDGQLADQIREAVKPYRMETHSSAFAPEVDAGRLNQWMDEMESAEFLAQHQARP
jgi:hypothetical protein